MNIQDDLAQGWFRKAENDFATIRLILASQGPYDVACFHAQQAAEKYLKGLISLCGVDFPYTHNLIALNDVCLEHVKDWSLEDSIRFFYNSLCL
jgi:HEPN domain-containing protein